MNNEISKELEEVVNKIRNKIETKKIIIFGSYAKGKETENSDIELCIITEEKRKRLEIIWDIREAIFEETTHSYDIFVYNKIDFESNLNLTTSIENQINSHGIILYEQN